MTMIGNSSWQKFGEIVPLAVLASLLPLGSRAQSPQQSESPVANQVTSDATHEQHVCDDLSGIVVGKPVLRQTVSPGLLIHKVAPKYPKAARKAHIEGTVVLCGVIGKDGKVAKLQVMSGPKELIAPAIEAVQQWLYKPYLLDGEPVDVVTDIRVNFNLSR